MLSLYALILQSARATTNSASRILPNDPSDGSLPAPNGVAAMDEDDDLGMHGPSSSSRPASAGQRGAGSRPPTASGSGRGSQNRQATLGETFGRSGRGTQQVSIVPLTPSFGLYLSISDAKHRTFLAKILVKHLVPSPASHSSGSLWKIVSHYACNDLPAECNTSLIGTAHFLRCARVTNRFTSCATAPDRTGHGIHSCLWLEPCASIMHSHEHDAWWCRASQTLRLGARQQQEGGKEERLAPLLHLL